MFKETRVNIKKENSDSSDKGEEIRKGEESLETKNSDSHIRVKLLGISKRLGENVDYLLKLIEKSPKTLKEIEELNEGLNSPESKEIAKRLWNRVKLSSSKYLTAVAEHNKTSFSRNFSDNSSDLRMMQGSIKEADESRRIVHNGLISNINPWVRYLKGEGIDMSFMSGIYREKRVEELTQEERDAYGEFGLSIILQRHIDSI